MSPRFSIIMPVYNAGAYLADAVGSVLNQSYLDFELILVDDGATDGSGERCDKVAAEDSRVRVIHTANGGIAKARNTGLSAATGEYVMFCDHDDEYLPGYLEEVARCIDAEGHPEIVKVDHETLRRDVSGNTEMKYPGGFVMTHDMRFPFDYASFWDMTCLIWDGAYRRSIIKENRIEFDESFLFGCDDLLFMRQVLLASQRSMWLGKTLYRHYLNDRMSVSTRAHPELFNDYLRIIKFEMATWGTVNATYAISRLRRWIAQIEDCVMYVEDGALDKKQCRFQTSRFMRELLPAWFSMRALFSSGVGVSERVLLFMSAFRLCWLFGLVKVYLHHLRTRNDHDNK